jgi:hypothetical protein
MNRLTRFAALTIAVVIIILLNAYDNLALEHEARYGLILRGVVWLVIGVLAIASYENIKSIFAKE